MAAITSYDDKCVMESIVSRNLSTGKAININEEIGKLGNWFISQFPHFLIS